MNKKFTILAVVFSTTVSSVAQVCNIDVAKKKQYIDGFGASTAWHGQITQAEANAAFKNDTSNQLGLSILRVRIDPNSSWTDEKANAQKAKALGALILASPWTPPVSMKTNSNTVGGELKTTSYAAYAAYLKSFCDNLGIVDVISIQNEPNITVTYESCTWSAVQLKNFCKNNASDIGKPILMPEAYNFDTRYSDSTLNDTAAAAKITYVGEHLYGATPWSYTNALNKGKRVWMTEHYYNNDDIGTCITMATEILNCMFYNMSAYVWWYLRQPGCNLINAGGSIKKKGYVMAHFSKFVRPGYYRVDAPFQPQPGIIVVAFKGAESVVVAINLNNSQKTQTFKLKNDSTNRVIKYSTSAIKNLAYEGTINLTDSSFTTTLDARSINTFVSTKKTDCAQTPIIPHLQVNNGEVLDTDKVSVFTGDSIVLSPEAGSDGLWNWSGCGASGINNIQTIHPNGTCTSVVVTYTNTCKAQTALQYAVTVKPKVGMLSSEYNNNVLIYPNPAVSGIFTIKVPDYLIGNKIIIYNLVGEQVYGNSLTGSVNIINSGLTPGMYIFKVSGKGSFISEKLILK